MGLLEKTLYYDGIAFMRYSLAFPSGEAFGFAESMTHTYATYLEKDYLTKLCAEYDADPERRKRYRHKLVEVKQNFQLYEAGAIASLLFQVREKEQRCAFAFTWNKERGVLMKPCDLGLDKRESGRNRSFFYDGVNVYLYDKNGELCRKVKLPK